jgi:deoxyribodipyrimidine photolyase-related protein
MPRRWLFADQLGPHFLDDPHQPVLLIESKAVFRRRAFHRQKAHLILSALRHRAAELGDRAVHLRTETYRKALDRLGEEVTVCHPTSRRAHRLVRALPGVTVLPARGFVTSTADFVEWADGRRGALRFEDFYRHARIRHRVLVEPADPDLPPDPTGGRWLLDAGGRGADARHAEPPVALEEDDIDAEVRRDLDRWADEGIHFVGRDGPRRFPATRAEALARLDHFLQHRLPLFGPGNDAMRSGDPYLAHSGLSPALNLGLLDPLEVVRAAEAAYRSGHAPLPAVETFIRHLLGWRDYVWHLYWYFDAGYPVRPRQRLPRTVPAWFAELDADAVGARCLADTLAAVRDRGWTHHTPRLAVLANYALHRGWRTAELVDWFHRVFVDGHEWALTGNVMGMSPYADLDRLANRAYALNGGHLNRLGDYCAGCRYEPRRHLGERACPYTAGYYLYLERNRGRLPSNARTLRALRRLDLLPGRAEVRRQERERDSRVP